MDLKHFLEANRAKIGPDKVPVSHPDKGFDIIPKKSLHLYKDWGWTEESFDVVSEPKGAKKSGGRRKKSTAEKSE